MKFTPEGWANTIAVVNKEWPKNSATGRAATSHAMIRHATATMDQIMMGRTATIFADSSRYESHQRVARIGRVAGIEELVLTQQVFLEGHR
jgi:hypothetical protein